MKQVGTIERIRQLHAELAELQQDLESSVEGAVLSLPAKLRDVRQRYGYTQEEVANQMGVGRTQYCNIEAGRSRITIEGLMRFCFALGVSADELFSLNKVTREKADSNKPDA